MNSFSQILLKIFPDRDPGKWRPKSEGAWKIIFSLTAGALFLFLCWHTVLFYYVFTRDTFFYSEEPLFIGEKALNEAGLKKVLSIFEAKKERNEQIILTPLKIQDPSHPSVAEEKSATVKPVTSKPLISQ